jgi:preprotein translocase subunit SecE
MVNKIKTFVNEVVREMKKVSWPSKDQLRESTIVVVVTTIIITTIVWIIDMGMDSVIKAIF